MLKNKFSFFFFMFVKCVHISEASLTIETKIKRDYVRTSASDVKQIPANVYLFSIKGGKL